MVRYIASHVIEYFLIYVIFAAGVWVLFSTNALLIKVSVIFALGSIYFIWAIWHHIDDHKQFNFNVLMEYVSILVLILWLLFSLI